jgi:predicted XRE-type DNA-binding protein
VGQNTYLETGFPDEEATVMALEADTAIAIAGFIRARFPNNQAGAAKSLGIHQNEVSAILSGNIGRFSLEKLIRLARRAGLRMFLDMGDDAHGAAATTLAPTFATSAVVIGNVKISNEDTPSVDFKPQASGAETARKIIRVEP